MDPAGHPVVRRLLAAAASLAWAACSVVDTSHSPLVGQPGDAATVVEVDAGAGPSRPSPARLHAVGSWEQAGERHAGYWRSASLDQPSFARLDLPGPAGEVPRTLALLGARAFVQSTAGNFWTVDGAGVQFVDLAAQVGSGLAPLGALADGARVRIAARTMTAPGELHLWTWEAGALTHAALAVDPLAALEGDAALLSGGSLLLAGTLATSTAARFQAHLWVPGAAGAEAWPLEAPAGYRAIYGAAADSGGLVHLGGEGAESADSFSWATYWRVERPAQGSPVVTRARLPSQESSRQGSLATAVALDGSEVLLAGVLLDCWERDATAPALWRVERSGEGVATLAVLPAGSPWQEPWANAVRAWEGAAFVGGEDERQAAIWTVRPGEPVAPPVRLDGVSVADLQLGD